MNNQQNESKIGDRLQALLDSSGLTPYALSNKIRISQATLGRVLKNASKPNATNMKLLSEYFNVSEAWLSTGIENNKVQEPGSKYTKEEQEALDKDKPMEELMDKYGEDLIITYIMKRYDKFKDNTMFNILVSHHNTLTNK